MNTSSHNNQAGFSLIQISILLTVASLIMIAVLPSPQGTVKRAANSVTKMNTIMLALRQYQAANGVLPCPADPTQPTGSNTYGVASTNTGTTNNCVTGSAPNAAYADSTNHIAIGMVPVFTLGLSADYALDAYGRDITYAVDTNATAIYCPVAALPGAISVNDNGNIHNTIAALISHGQNGYGAWLPLQGTSGTAPRFDSGSTDASQADNAQVQHGGGLTANGAGQFASFVNKSATSTFDDFVVYRSSPFNLNSIPQAYISSSAYQAAYAASCGATYYRTITIDHTKVPNTDQSYFPMLFAGTYSYLATVANGGSVQNSNGYDIYFSSDALGTHVLPFERASYNPATGAVSFWVQVPTASHTSDTVIYLQYSSPNINLDKSNKTGTWDSNYVGVWHLDETSSTVNTDSTSNGTTEIKVSATSPAPLATGKINGADSFNGSSDYTQASSSTTDLTGDMTFEMWVNAQAWGNQPSTTYSQRYASDAKDSNNGYQLSDYGNSSDGSGFVFAVNIAGTQYIVSTANSGGYSLNTWYHVVGTYTAASHTALLYVNGSLPGNGTASGWGLGFNPGHLTLGVRVDGNGYAKAYLDEVRLSSSVRSADWIATEYANQSAPDKASYGASGFYTVGSAVAR